MQFRKSSLNLVKNLLGKKQNSAYFSTINYNFVSNFSPEINELRTSVRRFADEVILPIANKTDLENSFPINDLWKQMGQLGYLGVRQSSEFGGSELDYTAHCMIMEEFSRASASIALSYGAHSALCIEVLDKFANQEQKQKYLGKLCMGEYIGALAMSEPGSGSDVVSMRTKAVKQGDKYIINGNKMWITNGPDANVIVLYAKTEQGITAFLIEKGMKGFSTAQKLDKLGMRGSNTCELVFENCEVPEENILGEVNKGVYILMKGLETERLILSAGPLGIMQACLDEVIPYIQTREQFGEKIGSFQLMQGKVADMYVKTQSSRAYLYACARALDEGSISNADCAGLILHNSERAVEVALEAIQSLGGNGYINEYPTGRFLRDAKLYAIGAGTNEIRRWLIGRELMKATPSN